MTYIGAGESIGPGLSPDDLLTRDKDDEFPQAHRGVIDNYCEESICPEVDDELQHLQCLEEVILGISLVDESILAVLSIDLENLPWLSTEELRVIARNIWIYVDSLIRSGELNAGLYTETSLQFRQVIINLLHHIAEAQEALLRARKNRLNSSLSATQSNLAMVITANINGRLVRLHQALTEKDDIAFAAIIGTLKMHEESQREVSEPEASPTIKWTDIRLGPGAIRRTVMIESILNRIEHIFDRLSELITEKDHISWQLRRILENRLWLVNKEWSDAEEWFAEPEDMEKNSDGTEKKNEGSGADQNSDNNRGGSHQNGGGDDRTEESNGAEGGAGGDDQEDKGGRKDGAVAKEDDEDEVAGISQKRLEKLVLEMVEKGRVMLVADFIAEVATHEDFMRFQQQRTTVPVSGTYTEDFPEPVRPGSWDIEFSHDGQVVESNVIIRQLESMEHVHLMVRDGGQISPTNEERRKWSRQYFRDGHRVNIHFYVQVEDVSDRSELRDGASQNAGKHRMILVYHREDQEKLLDAKYKDIPSPERTEGRNQVVYDLPDYLMPGDSDFQFILNLLLNQQTSVLAGYVLFGDAVGQDGILESELKLMIAGSSGNVRGSIGNLISARPHEHGKAKSKQSTPKEKWRPFRRKPKTKKRQPTTPYIKGADSLPFETSAPSPGVTHTRSSSLESTSQLRVATNSPASDSHSGDYNTGTGESGISSRADTSLEVRDTSSPYMLTPGSQLSSQGSFRSGEGSELSDSQPVSLSSDDRQLEAGRVESTEALLDQASNRLSTILSDGGEGTPRQTTEGQSFVFEDTPQPGLGGRSQSMGELRLSRVQRYEEATPEYPIIVWIHRERLPVNEEVQGYWRLLQILMENVNTIDKDVSNELSQTVLMLVQKEGGYNELAQSLLFSLEEAIHLEEVEYEEVDDMLNNYLKVSGSTVMSLGRILWNHFGNKFSLMYRRATERPGRASR